MLFDFSSSQTLPGDELVARRPAPCRWGVDSEYGVLRDVMLAAPPHLEMVPCNEVTRESLDQGLVCCRNKAADQHAALVGALEREGVRCHFVPPAETMPDLSFTRDAVAMTPWGMVELVPAVAHRKAEAAYVAQAAAGWGVPLLGALPEGRAEGGDICVLRPGTVIIGYSGERTDKAGAKAMARIFESHGWEAILYCFDPRFLHLDTQLTMLDRHRAIACVEVLEAGLRDRLDGLGIELVPVTLDEVRRLGANLLSLGEERLVSSAGNQRVNRTLDRLGYRVIEVEIDQFTRCGGGVHCLTNALARLPG